MKVAIVVVGGVVQTVYSDEQNVEVEIVDLDGHDNIKDAERLEARAEELEVYTPFNQVYP